jgi:hypothetical protein
MNVLCFLFGHKIASYTDGGFEICSRCNAHEYYDGYGCGENGKWNKTVPAFYYRNRRIVQNIKDLVYHKCSDCGKPDKVLGVTKYKNHKECLPF